MNEAEQYRQPVCAIGTDTPSYAPITSLKEALFDGNDDSLHPYAKEDEAGDSLVSRSQQFEVEWCNVHWNGHASVVRIDGSILLYLLVVGRHLCLTASHQREYGDQE